MANQPQNTPKGQIKSNTGATPPKGVNTGKHLQNMKRINHNGKLQKHNDNVKGITNAA